jgi:geranylgeranyl pyrophosphate synthase
MEIHNMYLYFHNWIFDNKNRVWDDKSASARNRISNTIIAASLTRELIIQAINAANLPLEKKLLISKELSDSTLENYYGFFLDINLTIDKISRYKTDQAFLKIYEEKSRLLSGNMYSLSSKAGAILANAPKEKIEAVAALGDLLGTGLHISNDLGDFAQPRKTKVTFGKPYQDQLADIRENRLTLPIYYVLKYGNKSEKEALLKLVANYSPTGNQIRSVVESLHTSGSYNYCKKYVRSFFNKAKQKLHISFAKSKERDLYAMMLSIIRTNKFLAELRDFSNDSKH